MDHQSNQVGFSNGNAPATQAAPPFVFAPPPAEAAGFDFWGVLQRRKWLVFLGLITGMGIGALVWSKSDTIYESEAAISIEPKEKPGLDLSRTARMTPETSDLVRHEKLIGQENIVKVMLGNNNMRTLPSFDDIPEEEVVKEVIGNFEATADREALYIYTLKYWSKDKKDSATILNNLIQTYEEDLIRRYSQEADEYVTVLNEFKNTFLRQRVAVKKQLDDLIDSLDSYVFADGYTIHDKQMIEQSARIGDLQEELNQKSTLRRQNAEALQAGAEAIEAQVWNLEQQKMLSASNTDGKNRALERVEGSIMNAQSEYFALESQVGPGHPALDRISKQLDFLTAQRDQIQQSEASIEKEDAFGLSDETKLRRYQNRIEESINLLQQDIAETTEQYEMHAAEAVKLSNIQRKIKLQEDELESIKEMLKQAENKMYELSPGGDLARSEKQEGYRFQRLAVATEGKQVWPLLHVLLGVGGLLGSLAGFGLGCLVELADKTFHNPDEIIHQLNVPLIGHIPVIGQGKRYLVEGSVIEPAVCTYHRPKSQVSEAFRAVRTALYFNTQGKQHSVIQVTSPTPGDGKSTLASNLAVSIAQSGKRVLLVDADMRRPRQHATFGITAKQGFATVLSGESHWRECLYEVEELEGLSIMPCGSRPQNPAELCSSPQVKDLIAEMREEFDFVVIDSPPLLAVTDACPIAARVDGVILCLRIKKNVRVSAERATEMLRNLGANCIGLVVNGVGAQSGYGSQYTYGAYRAGYSYNGYGYGYGYGEGYGSSKYYEADEKGRSVTPTPPRNIESQPQ